MMNKTTFFEFKVDKQSKKINVDRSFNAPLDLVWAAWTEPEILDQWWAPRPYRNETVSMDFREGGRWHYCMISPEDEKHYCLFDYEKIEPEKSYSGMDAFCDEQENISEAMPRMRWHNRFEERADDTLVKVEVSFDDLADLEKVIEMGFKEGFTMGLNNLDDYIKTHLRKSKKPDSKV